MREREELSISLYHSHPQRPSDGCPAYSWHCWHCGRRRWEERDRQLCGDSKVLAEKKGVEKKGKGSGGGVWKRVRRALCHLGALCLSLSYGLNI